MKPATARAPHPWPIAHFRHPLALLAVLLLSTQPTAFPSSAAPISRSIDGSWYVRLDPADAGLRDAWFGRPLGSSTRIQLPGTTDRAGLGPALDPVTLRYPFEFPYTRFPGVQPTPRADEWGFPVGAHCFLGAAWFERTIEIPRGWQDADVLLRLERALWRTDAWIDGRPAGADDSLATPHEHFLGPLAPGPHRLTLRVDNRMIHNLSTITHAYGPETQSRWNGAIGRLELVPLPPVAIRRLDVFPAADRRSATVRATIRVAAGRDGNARLALELRAQPGHRPLAQTSLAVHPGPGVSAVEGQLTLADPAAPWDEFTPRLYRVEATLAPSVGPPSQTQAVFGFRQIERDGRALRLNGRRLFLRGTLDCAVHPRTGHPPMTLEAWRGILRNARNLGFNHVRFHTWCPPEAAFTAADELGLYLMPETAAWIDDWTIDTFSHPTGLGHDPAVAAFITTELRRMLETYGNHPSFLLCGIGNEFGLNATDWEQVSRWVAEAKARDPRRLYAGCTARRTLVPDDFWVTHDAHGKGTRGVGPARTDWDFRAAAQAADLPVIAHETGQRPVFPDYESLLPAFTGPLRPFNYLRLQKRLLASGLADQAPDFRRASARFQAVLYKAEHEAMRRTADFAGYQLLMLGDFTGQSEALVGVLDPFGRAKDKPSTDLLRAWNSPTVPLARFSTYTWSCDRPLRAQLDVAHSGPTDLIDAPAHWELRRVRGRPLAAGRIAVPRIPGGTVMHLADLEVPLTSLDRPTALELRVTVAGHQNAWRLWAYPPPPPDPAVEGNDGLLVTNVWNSGVEHALAEGRPVLFLAHGLENAHAKRTGFESVYWSAGWWGNAFSTLGILCDPAHPALAGFPNDGHGDWQWRELTAGATTFRLDDTPSSLRPIVQPIPDFHFCSRLGQVFEVRTTTSKGAGRLLVCGYDLNRDLEHRPAARQFRSSLLRYAGSPAFRPRVVVTLEALRPLLSR